MISKRIIAHLMILLIALPPQAVMADMLRQNLSQGQQAGAVPAADSSAASAANAAAAAAQARASAQDMLSRNMMAVQSVQAMQDAARAAAATMNNAGANPNLIGTTLPDVPDGLVTGGLDFTSAIGANAPTQSMDNARTIVEIQQTQQQAMLEWKTFNVGRQTTVQFDQSAGGADAASWIAFNRITDPSGNPSQILGSIKAQGQVYVINQNGIIFGGASEVNTGSLTASSLPLNDNLITRGLLNNPDSQFLFSANAQAAGTKGPTPAYTPPSPPASGRIGDVTVQAGARITAPTSSANVGGRVALIGPNVTNNGTVSTPDGQTILAAGMEVGFDAHSSDDPSLRGLDVYVGSAGTYGGTATNNGLVTAERGSVLITGKSVNQNGFISATTSAALNGRVDLLANYNATPNTAYNPANPDLGGPFVYPSGGSTGIVRTGQDSVVQILPEYDSTLKVVGTELALKSKVNMQGLGVYLGRGSVLYAPSGDVAISAGVWDLVASGTSTLQDFVAASGQIYLDEGAQVNVSGSTAVSAEISQYILEVTLRAAELADSPLQRNSSLRGQTVTVDMRESGVLADGTVWYGTPLANLTGYLGVIERNVGQLTTQGGQVSISAGESVVMREGAAVNVNGGYQEFASGTVSTTRLVDDGNLVDIAKADRSVVYDGIYAGTASSTDPRWGTTTTTTGMFADTVRVEDGHVYGGAAGSVAISAASMALDGTFTGTAVTGQQQLGLAPAQGSLALSWEAQLTTRQPVNLPFTSPTPPRIEFRDGASGLATPAAFGVDAFDAPLTLRQERRDAVVLPPAWVSAGGFGSLSVKNVNGDIVVPAGVVLAAKAGGSITLTGANVLVDGSIEAPAGKINLTAYNLSPYKTAELIITTGAIPSATPGRGLVRVAAGSRLSVAGLVINDRADGRAALTVPRSIAGSSTTAGGTINIRAFSAELAIGSMLDVSGGLVADRAFVYGNGGSLAIRAGNDPALAGLLGGRLVLDSTLNGFSGARGASIALQAPVVQIGGTAAFATTLLLQPSFFENNGFSRFTLTGIGPDNNSGQGTVFTPTVIVAAGTSVSPVVRRLQAQVAQGEDGSRILLSTLLEPEGYRDTAEITLVAPGVRDLLSQLKIRGDILLDTGSLIRTDALGKVTLSAHTIDLLGSIDAPAGQIQILADKHYPVAGDAAFARTTLHLGSGSRVSASGRTVLLADRYGRRRGTVYDGGAIVLQGNIIAEAGAMLDVSGTSAVLDLLPEEAGVPLSSFGTTSQVARAMLSVPVTVDSNGGSIHLVGGEFLHTAATLQGRAGGITAAGGSVSVHSDIFVLPGASKNDKEINLVVAQSITSLPAPMLTVGQPVIGLAPGGTITSRGYFGADSFLTGGFDSLSLEGNVQFRGAVSITAAGSLHVATGGVMEADAALNFTAGYVALGRPLINPVREEELVNPFQLNIPGTATVPSFFSPSFGSGMLQVSAEFVETGFISLQGIGNAAVTARQDLRGNGFFDIAGHLSVNAGQIYPVTASPFTITAYDYVENSVAKMGSVTITSSGQTPEFPLSGGGRLSVYASTINQAGVLRSPLGTIVLGWDGSGAAPKGLVTNTAVPVTQQITLSAGSITSVSAIDPVTGQGVIIPYGIVKDGTNWIDPTGFDITSVGAPEKEIRVSARNVTTEEGSEIDIRGGGELYGYRWVQGNGGTKDILASEGAFAILPGYGSALAPFAPFATSGLNVGNLGGDAGYHNSTLQVGDQIRLKLSSILAEGTYTLLPARYALLPGAFLVTPSSNTPVDAFTKPGGAVQTTGYRFNSLNSAVAGQVYESFEIAPANVVRVRAEYVDYSAQAFIPAAQQRLGLNTTLVPADAGYALLSANLGMNLAGGLSASGVSGGRGGRVDVSSPLDIVIAAPGALPQPGKLLLNAALLSGWRAESLLIGGVRDDAGNVTVRTTNLTLDNAGSSLTGTDVLLAATQNLTLAGGASLLQSGSQTSADAFVVGGNGTLVRVSGVVGAQTSRSGVTASALPSLTIGANAAITGRTVTLDSTDATTLDLTTQLTASTIQLNSGRISIQLANPGALQPNAGLVLGGGLLTALQASSSLSLLSYSSIDFYGTGSFASSGALELHAGEIRGFNQNGGSIDLTAQSLVLDNSALASLPGIAAAANGVFNFTANTITLGKNALVIDQFNTVTLTAAQGLTVRETGAFRAQNALNIVAPFIRAESKTSQLIGAGGLLHLSRPAAAFSPVTLGLGGLLTLEGNSILAESDVLLPSGLITLHATAGNVTLNGLLNAGGVDRQYFDATRYTDAGRIVMTADAGDVVVGTTGVINIAAQPGGGDAGTLAVKAANQFVLSGTLAGQGATTGSFELDVGSLASFADLNTRLNAGAFTTSRELRVRNGGINIDGTVNARRFLLALDNGAITVNGTINASGSTGGRIDLIARDGVTLANGSMLSVHGQAFDNSGKGGGIWIESTGTGSINIAAGSTLDLGVDAKTADSASRGQFSGKVHLRARQNATFNDLLIDPIAGTFLDASAIEIEGFRVYAFDQANVLLRAGTTALGGETLTTTTIHNNSTSFMANYSAMFTRLLGGNTSIQSVSVLQPGVEIVNRGGSISLGTPTSGSGADWDLSSFRYGPLSAAGTLTMRATGNLEFYNTLSDGFTLATSGNIPERMWMARLSTPNANLPVNAQSWTYRLAAGADLTAADHREVLPQTSLAGETGSLLLGKDAGQAVPTSSGANSSPGDTALTRLAINPTNANNASASNRFQVIRTGTGDIEISTGRDVQLLNQFATIYTAGVSVPTVTTVFSANDFVAPIVNNSTLNQLGLGSIQQLYVAQYSRAGGDVSINAGRDVVHYTLNSSGSLILDSQRQLPNNWLLRRGYVNPSGQYGQIFVASSSSVRVNDTAASTSWWVDFSNFFDGIATLGGGDVAIHAGRDVQNVSAHAVTNARAARGTPSADGLLEMGGGDVTVVAGRNVDGGIYYVERGNALINAGGEITTNAARSPSLGYLESSTPVFAPEQTWLPATFFLGRGALDIRAGGDALIGPVANTMLLPQGLTNRHWYKAWFSTYGQESAVRVSSLGGDVTLRQAAVLPGTSTPESILGIWMANMLLLSPGNASNFHPWLRLVETQVAPFTKTFSTLMPGTLKIAAHSGDINLVGNATLSPSVIGTLELLATGAVNGLSPAGVTTGLVPGRQTTAWVSSSINVSDANPSSIPGMLSPFAYYQTYFNPSVLVTQQINNNDAKVTGDIFLAGVDIFLQESGSTSGTFASLQVKQGLHTSGGLHTGDASPVRISALSGDISGLELFSPKSTRVLAGRDITDVSFYIQNLSTSDASIVSSGRDLVAYNANSALRTLASLDGNLPATQEGPLAGDIQISGPGTLQVLAGRDINLGTGSNNSDGTGVGVTSIGNGRNPSLLFDGADIVLAAGLGGVSSGLGASNASFADFIYAIQYDQGVLPPGVTTPKYPLDGRRYLSELAARLQSDGLRGLPASILSADSHSSAPAVWDAGVVENGVRVRSGNINVGGEPSPDAFLLPNSINLDDPSLTTAQREQLALSLYYFALRDAGRDRNNPDSPDVNTYRAGYEAIQTIFPAADVLQRDNSGNIVLNPSTGDPVVDTSGINLIQGESRPIPGYTFDGNILTQARDVRTKSGGSISILAPAGGLQLASTLIGSTLAPPGIITESGGNISIFADSDVSIGISRIFTLRGGDISIWSTVGDIAAGSSSKTVQSAPPTRVLINPQSANVVTDLAGLATGGGIGVLATVAGVRPGNVDLIAPIGAVDAGDAGIRATGNLNIAAAVVLNAANISVGGGVAGAPSAPAVSTPSLGGLASAAAAGAATGNSPAAKEAAKQTQDAKQESQTPSIITVEVLGYGGGEGASEEDARTRRGGAE